MYRRAKQEGFAEGCADCFESRMKRKASAQEFAMTPRMEVSEGRVFRSSRKREILCRLTYEVTPFREGLFRWFLIRIEELE
jgi:hypothetical protein